ncbi:MAG: hypothetical protein ACI845_004241 [Gammaproteobacteria bacterium]
MKIQPAQKIQLFVIVTFAILLLIFSADYLGGVEHNIDSPGLQESRQWVLQTRSKLANSNAKIVVVGNSMAGYGFDETLFSQISGKSTINVWRKGSASAWFYLAIKNLVLIEKNPRNLVIIFRDNILTRPNLRTWGRFKHDIDALIDHDASLLDELAYLNHKNTQYYLSSYLPLFKDRSLWSDKVKFSIESFVSQNLLGIEVGQLISSLNQLFTFNGILYREAGIQSYYSSTQLQPENLRFAENLERSFLPHIVALCKQHRVKLTIIRLQRLVDEEKLRDTGLLENYIDELSEYAKNEGFRLIDFTDKNWLQRNHYSSNDHLNTAGKEQFTREIYRQLNQTK